MESVRYEEGGVMVERWLQVVSDQKKLSFKSESQNPTPDIGMCVCVCVCVCVSVCVCV